MIWKLRHEILGVIYLSKYKTRRWISWVDGKRGSIKKKLEWSVHGNLYLVIWINKQINK